MIIIKMELDNNPQWITRQIKDFNFALLYNICLSLVKHRIHNYLDFSYNTALRKPILTTCKIVYFFIAIVRSIENDHKTHLI